MKKSFEEKFMIFFLLLVIISAMMGLLSGCKKSESLKDQSRINSDSHVRLQSSYDDYLMNTVIHKRDN